MTAKMYQAKTNIATLLPNGQPNRVVGSLDGATMSMLQANSAMIADGSIVDADIAASAAIAKSKLAALGITDADIAAAAAIALSKLAPGASGLLKSNGSAISAGNQLATADVPLGFVTSSMIADRGVGEVDLALNSVTNNQIAPNTIHPGRLTSWSGNTYQGQVLYDAGAASGVSVAPVQSLIGAGTITTAMLAAGAVSQFGQTGLSGSSTSSTIANDMTGASVSLTTVAGSLVIFLVHLNNMYNSSATGSCVVQLWEGGTLMWNMLFGDLITAWAQDRMGYFASGPAAGAHTWRLAWYTTAGTANHAGGLFSVLELRR